MLSLPQSLSIDNTRLRVSEKKLLKDNIKLNRNCKVCSLLRKSKRLNVIALFPGLHLSFVTCKSVNKAAEWILGMRLQWPGNEAAMVCE